MAKYFVCEDCDTVLPEPCDVGNKCSCGGIFSELDEETTALIQAGKGTEKAFSGIEQDD